MLTSSAGCGWACWTGRWRAIDWWVERTRPPTGGFVITGSARGILPYGPSLVSAAHDLFSFVSAGEGPPQATAEEAPLDSRVKGIEDAVLGLRGGLEALREELQHRNLGGPADAQNLAGPSRGPARPKAKGAIPGLDAAVLASARAAGIPEEQLVKMGELASRAGKLGDGARAKASILSESEEEDVPGAGGAEESSPGNVSEAICKMTAILSQLARSRKPGSLEDLLDRGESAEAGSSGSLSGGSSKAAAYQKLSTLLRDDPGKIASSVLKLMSEDFSCHRSAPGLDGVTMTARGWLEHRSRVQQYTCAVGLADSRSFGLSAGGSRGGVQSPAVSHVVRIRPKLPGPGSGDASGAVAPDSQLCEAQSPGGGRGAPHQDHGHPLGLAS